MNFVAKYKSTNHLPLMNLPDQIDFAQLCKDIRKAKGYSQTEMASILGIDVRSYKRYEAGEREPTGQIAWKLALILQQTNLPTK